MFLPFPVWRRLSRRPHPEPQVCFTVPMFPAYFASSDEGGSARLEVMATVALPEGDHWGVDQWALQLPTPLDVMWPNVFPISFWRR